MKYIIYCRKSTDSEDRQVKSLPAQKRELKELSKRLNLTVVDLYEESGSAFKTGRPLFNEMIQRIQDGDANGIIVWAYNRLARNALDGAMIIHLLDTCELKEIVTPTSRTNGGGNSKFMLQLEFAMSKKTSDDNSEAVKRGNREKILKGWDIRRHAGYKFIEQEVTKEKILVPDVERFSLLQKAIKLVLKRKPVSDVLDMLNNYWGYRTPQTKHLGDKPMTRSNFYKVLHDEFYCGWIYTKQNERVRGKHEPMITEQEFDEIQLILGEKGKPRPKSLILPYRAIIYCGECGCTICMQEKHQCICSECKTKFASKNSNHCRACKTRITDMTNPTHLHYIYAGCTKKKKEVSCSQRYVNLKKLEKQFSEYLASLQLSEKVSEWVLQQLAKKHKEEFITRDQARRNFEVAIKKVQDKLDALLTIYASPENLNHDLISTEEYQKRKQQLQDERSDSERNLSRLSEDADHYMVECEKTFDFAITAKERFDNGDAMLKTEIIRELGSNLILENQKVTIDQDYPWLYIRKAKQEIDELKSQGLEPDKSIDTYEKTGVSDQVIISMQGRRDLNPHGVFWRH